MKQFTTARLTFVALLLLAAAPMLASETLPTPYTAEQIREAWVPGLVVVSRVEASGQTILTRTEVIAADSEQVTLSAQQTDPDGNYLPEVAEHKASWTELRDHARFPADRAERRRQRRETPLGELDGWLYEVDHGDGSRGSFFFADDYPGSPVVFVQYHGKAATMLSEQIERRVE
ncbi:MAG: hypothetical protein AAF604_00925 [Acidobacteriota bacterium]